MYYLAREKLERDRVYGPGQFASSQLSVTGDAANATAASMATPTEDKSSPRPVASANSNQPHYSAPGTAPSRKDPIASTKGKADYSMPLPRLPAPETSHYSGMSYDNSTTTASPTSAAFTVPQMPTPRARDPGAGLPSLPPSPSVPTTAAAPATSPPTQTIPSRQHVEIDENATIGPKRTLPRAPPPSTHRRSHSMSQRPTMLTTRWGGMFGGQHGATPACDENGKVIPEPPRTVGPDTSSFPPSPLSDDKDKDHDHTSPFSGGATLVRKFGSLLVGGSDGSRKHAPARRGTILGSGATAAPATTDDEKTVVPTPVEKEALKDDDPSSIASDVPHRRTPPPITTIIHTTPPSPTSIASSVPTRKSFVTQQFTNAHRRAATILDPQGRATRHERRSSTGGVAIMGNTPGSGAASIGGGTIGRTRRPSTGYSTSGKPLTERLFGAKTSEPVSLHGRESEMAEKKEEEYADGAHEALYSGDVTDREEDDRGAVKPIFLKGLFRYILLSSSLNFIEFAFIVSRLHRPNNQPPSRLIYVVS